MTEHSLRIYDPHSESPQPIGPMTIELPDGASEEQIVEQIRREYVNQSRPADVGWNGSRFNRGWAVVYRDGEGDTQRKGRPTIPYAHLITAEELGDEAVAEIAFRLEVDRAKAQHLWNAMGVVYDLLAEDGIVDSFGGAESRRVIPEALEYIRRTANRPPR